MDDVAKLEILLSNNESPNQRFLNGFHLCYALSFDARNVIRRQREKSSGKKILPRALLSRFSAGNRDDELNHFE